MSNIAIIDREFRVRRDGLEGLHGDLANDMTMRVILRAVASL